MPSPDYSPALGALICTRIARGESVHDVCRTAGMPNVNTLYTWVGQYTDFANQYEEAWRARDATSASAGRHPRYTPALGAAICERIAAGESLHWICSTAGMPSVTTVRAWRRRYHDFAEQMEHALESNAERLADEMVEIAWDAKIDVKDKKMHLDVRKWLSTRIRPRKSGDREAAGINRPTIAISDEMLHREINKWVADYLRNSGLRIVPANATVILPSEASADGPSSVAASDVAPQGDPSRLATLAPQDEASGLATLAPQDEDEEADEIHDIVDLDR